MNSVTMKRYWNDEENDKKQDSTNSLTNLLWKIENRRKKQRPSNITLEQSSAEEENLKPMLNIESRKKKISFSPVRKENPNHENDKIITDNSNFTVITNFEFKRRKKIKRVLPDWLQNPTPIPSDLKTLSLAVDEIPQLDAQLASNLKKNNIYHFFPVQCKLIPWLLTYHRLNRKFWPRDVCVSAPTGSGKTLAFVLPIIQLLKNRVVRRIRAVVVLPTRDLGFQVFEVFKRYVRGTDLKVINLGDSTLEKEKNLLIAYDEVLGYRSLVDIVITTSGRLVDHLRYTTGFTLSSLKFLIIDEADRIIDSVQNSWLSHLDAQLPPFDEDMKFSSLTLSSVIKKPRRPQRLLFSATLSQDPEKLRYLNLFQPCLFASSVEQKNIKSDDEDDKQKVLGKYVIPSELSEFYTITPLAAKPLILYYIIKSHNWKRVLCFADSASSVHRLTYLLQQLNAMDEKAIQYNIAEVSSKLSDNIHRDILHKFTNGSIDILVATDTLARGIDVQNVNYVVLYDAPKFAKNYIHRIGRTGRAGRKGTSLVLITPEEKNEFDDLLKVCGKHEIENLVVPVNDIKKLETVYKNALEALRETMQMQKKQKKLLKHFGTMKLKFSSNKFKRKKT